jgi:hypothetical protein
MEVTIVIALHFRLGLIDEHFFWIGVARLSMTGRLSTTAMKFVNHGNINDEVRRPSNLQPIDLQVPTFWPRLVGTRLPRLVI